MTEHRIIIHAHPALLFASFKEFFIYEMIYDYLIDDVTMDTRLTDFIFMVDSHKSEII